jgi:hypothetical protein
MLRGARWCCCIVGCGGRTLIDSDPRIQKRDLRHPALSLLAYQTFSLHFTFDRGNDIAKYPIDVPFSERNVLDACVI